MYFSETSKVVTADNQITFLLVIKGKHGQFGKDKCRVKSFKFMKIHTFRVKWFVIWQIVNLFHTKWSKYFMSQKSKTSF